MLQNHYALEKISSFREAELEQRVRNSVDWGHTSQSSKKRSADELRPSSSSCRSAPLCSPNVYR